MTTQPTRLLVCGGAGYIGSHMCKLLSEHGYHVAVVDNLSTGHKEAVRWGQLYEGDIGDSAFLSRVFADVQPEGVLHFAAKSIVSESVSHPALYYPEQCVGLAQPVRAGSADPRLPADLFVHRRHLRCAAV